jgi:hypothetical protein
MKTSGGRWSTELVLFWLNLLRDILCRRCKPAGVQDNRHHEIAPIILANLGSVTLRNRWKTFQMNVFKKLLKFNIPFAKALLEPLNVALTNVGATREGKASGICEHDV